MQWTIKIYKKLKPKSKSSIRKWKTIIACVINARCSQHIMNVSTCKGKWGALNDDFNKNFNYMARIGKK
jgi:hypothetical protein